MKRSDAGYATVTVTALMIGLSVLAIAWMEQSVVSSRSADRLSAQVLSDIFLEGALYDALGQLINSRGMVEGSLKQTRFHSGEHQAIVSIVPMRDLMDVNSVPIDDIEGRLESLDLSPLQRQEILKRIKDHREQPAGPFVSLEELSAGEEFSSALPCLKQQFTVFHDPSPPIRRGESAKLGEGSLIRISSRTPGQQGAIEAVVLITGLSEEPYWIYDWKHTNEADHANC